MGAINDVGVDEEGHVYVVDPVWHAASRIGDKGESVVFGGPGNGPGEFPDGSGMGAVLPGDHEAVYVADIGGQRLSRFDPTGQFVEDTRFEDLDGIAMAWQGDGRGRLFGEVFPEAAMRPGSRAARVIREVDPHSATSELVAQLPLKETTRGEENTFLGREPIWAVARDGRLAVGFTTSRRIHVYQDSGSVRNVEITRERDRVSRAEQEAVHPEYPRVFREAGLPDEVIASLRDRLRVEDVYPFFTDMVFGPGGTLWLERPATVTELEEREGELRVEELRGHGSYEWDILDREGRLIARVAIPGFRPHAYRGDLLYGVEQRPTGEQLVTVYRVVAIDDNER